MRRPRRSAPLAFAEWAPMGCALTIGAALATWCGAAALVWWWIH